MTVKPIQNGLEESRQESRLLTTTRALLLENETSRRVMEPESKTHPECSPLKGRSRVAIEYRPIAELKLDPKNPRVHTSRQVRQIARSIKAFGVNVLVVIDANDWVGRKSRLSDSLI